MSDGSEWYLIIPKWSWFIPLNHLGSIWYHSESWDIPNFLNQFLGWDFFRRFLQQDGSSLCAVCNGLKTTGGPSRSLMYLGQKKGCIIVFGQDFANIAIVLKLQPSQQLAHRESHGPSFFFLLHIGLFFVLPCIENYQKVDLRTITLDVPPQEVNVFRVKYLPLIETIAGKHLIHENPNSRGPIARFLIENLIKMAFSSLLLIRSFVLLPSNLPPSPWFNWVFSDILSVCPSVCLSLSLTFSLSLYLSLSVCFNYFLAVLHTFLAGSLACLPCACFRFLTL